MAKLSIKIQSFHPILELSMKKQNVDLCFRYLENYELKYWL